MIHLLKSSLGTGILAMPIAFHHSGYLVGSVGTVVLGAIAVYCIHMLLATHYELCKRKRVSETNPTASKVCHCDRIKYWPRVDLCYVG